MQQTATLADNCLCAKEVAGILGISERGALELMRTGVIPSFRAGQKLWRTRRIYVEAYIEDKIAAHATALLESL
jgi:hypothetical protein